MVWIVTFEYFFFFYFGEDRGHEITIPQLHWLVSVFAEHRLGSLCYADGVKPRNPLANIAVINSELSAVNPSEDREEIRKSTARLGAS